MDLMFALEPDLSIKADLNPFISKIHDNFHLIQEAIPDQTCNMAPAAGVYTLQLTLELLKANKKRIMDIFAFAFMVNMLLPQV